jgi:hypothetical protein
MTTCTSVYVLTTPRQKIKKNLHFFKIYGLETRYEPEPEPYLFKQTEPEQYLVKQTEPEPCLVKQTEPER